MNRKDIDTAFMHTAEYYDFLIEHSPIGIVEFSPDMRILKCNTKFRQLLELTEEGTSGKLQYCQDLKFIKADGSPLPEEENPILRCTKLLVPVNDFLCGIMRPIRGDIVWILVSMQLQRDQEDRLQSIILILNDITALHETQDALARSETKYRYLIEMMSDVVWTSDLNFNITYISPSIHKAIGYSPEEFLQQKPLYGLTPESMANALAIFEQLLKRDQEKQLGPDETIEFDFASYHKDGSVVWFSNIVRVIRDGKGKITGLYGVTRNITGQKLAAEEREHLIADLTQALRDIKTLGGLLPICSHCKKIRDDKGYWNQLEAYITEHSDALFSHSICPDCAIKIYPELFTRKKEPI